MRDTTKRKRESELLREVIDTLALFTMPAIRINPGGTYRDGRYVKHASEGIPDVLSIVPGPGRLVGIECKVIREYVKPSQWAWLENLDSLGGVALVCVDVISLARDLDRLRADPASSGAAMETYFRKMLSSGQVRLRRERIQIQSIRPAAGG